MRPELHPACAAFPPLSEAKLQELADDIRANGLLHPIVLMPDNRLLDGRSRWEACERAGVEPRTKTYEGDDPVSYVLSANKHRRHMTENELVLAVAELHKPLMGRPPKSRASSSTFSAEEIAGKVGRHRTTLARAREINARAAPNVIDMVKRGEVGILPAAQALKDRPTHEEQAGWTKDTINQRSKAREEAGRGSKTSRPRKADKPPRQAPIRYGDVKFPTWEETGFPVNGTMEEKDAHMRRYGRTPLWPQTVKHMLENRAMLNNFLIPALQRLADEKLVPDAEAVLAGLDEMLAWKPKPDPDKMGYGIKFKNDAQSAMERIEKVLDTASERLTTLREAYAAWKATHTARGDAA